MVKADITLTNAKALISGSILRCGVAVEDGRICRIAKDPNLPKASEKIDLKGRLIMPGLIDVHVHFRDQALSYKEDFRSGTMAAANGGVTSAIDMPNNDPVTMNLESLRERIKEAERKTVINLAFYSAFPERAEEINRIVRDGGAVAFKLFLTRKVGGVDPCDEDAIIEALRESGRLGVPVAVHAESIKILRERAERIGELRTINDYLRLHSPSVEEETVRRMLHLIGDMHVRVHFCHVSSAGTVKMISEARESGIPVTCEVTPYHLLISSSDLRVKGFIALSDPPARDRRIINQLWTLLRRGMIDVIASDHAPHAIEEKTGDSILDVEAGVPGLEVTLPLMLTQADKGLISLPEIASLMCKRPAEIFGLTGRGELKEGNYADMVIVDLKRRYKIDPSHFYSKAKYSPFEGWEVKGKPVKTFVNGRLVMDEGEITAKPGSGRIIRWRS